MSRVRAAAAVVLVVATLALSGCGLPTADGVRRPGAVAAEQRLPEPISVLPPGPQRDATPEGVVLGFLAAQSSARDAHGIARGFLLPSARSGWDDTAGLTVYDPRTASAGRPAQQGDVVVVSLSIDVVGQVAADGAAQVQPVQTRVQRYSLRRDAADQWRLVGVPAGLTLSPAQRDRSYDPMSVHFLAPLGPSPSSRHLVADLVQLPVYGDRGQLLVQHLLDGPSQALAGSATSAVPAGTRLRRPVSTSASGVVTVDLTGPGGGLAAALAATARQDLSAQLVWTLRDALPDFTRLRLLVDGVSLQVPGVAEPQPREAWSSYDPDGPVGRPAGVALVDGQLRSLAPEGDDRVLAEEPAAVTGVADFAVDPRQARIAVLTRDGGTTTLRTGRFSGPLNAGLQDPGLRSPTWGSGELGLWLLRTGARPAVLLVPPDAAAAPVEVQVDGLPALDGSSLLRVSRDGTRVALVTGGVLYVGRLELTGRRPHLVALRRMTTGVRDVAWQTGTTLEVLVDDTEPPVLPLLRLSIDGTSALVTGLVGAAGGEPVAVTAYGAQPLLVETRADGRSTIYSGDSAAGFEVRLRDAVRPSYPR